MSESLAILDGFFDGSWLPILVQVGGSAIVLAAIWWGVPYLFDFFDRSAR